MTTDRILAAFALLTLIAFLSVLAIWVPRLDMRILIGIVILFVFYDFYRDLRPGSERS